MQERFIPVQRTARYHVLGDPASARTIWIVVHGYGQLARFFLNNFAGLEEGCCIVAPEGLSRFYLDQAHSRVGATWMTREDRQHEIDDHIRYLDTLVEHMLKEAPPNTVVNALGFSQGVATVARWAMHGRSTVQRLVLWAGPLPPEMEHHALSNWRALHVDLVLGDADEYATAEALGTMAQRLTTAGVPHATHVFKGGHQLDAILLRELWGR